MSWIARERIINLKVNIREKCIDIKILIGRNFDDGCVCEKNKNIMNFIYFEKSKKKGRCCIFSRHVKF